MIAVGSRQPAVLIVNPGAGRSSAAAREGIVAELATRFRLEVVTSAGRGDGLALAAQAAEAGVGLVIAFGGDGHVNEVANGLAGSASSLGIIPGGTMNVFARALGIPSDPISAVQHLERVGRCPPRSIPLGMMDERYFTFSGGCGFDAEAARLVEGDLSAKRRFGEPFFYWSAARVLASSYRHRNPGMRLHVDGEEYLVSMAIASNAGPYAYLAGRPVRIAPKVSLDGPLDLFALKRMRIEALPTYAWNCLVAGDISRHRDALYLSGLESFTVSSEQPFARHVDGEPLAPATSTSFRSVLDALRVKA